LSPFVGAAGGNDHHDAGGGGGGARTAAGSEEVMQVVPAADGTLYAYRRLDGAADSLPILQKLPLSAPELVESSPSLTMDGAVVMGVRRSSVVALDRADGRTVWTFSPERGRRALLPVRSSRTRSLRRVSRVRK